VGGSGAAPFVYANPVMVAAQTPIANGLGSLLGDFDRTMVLRERYRALRRSPYRLIADTPLSSAHTPGGERGRVNPVTFPERTWVSGTGGSGGHPRPAPRVAARIPPFQPAAEGITRPSISWGSAGPNQMLAQVSCVGIIVRLQPLSSRRADSACLPLGRTELLPSPRQGRLQPPFRSGQ